MLILQNSSRRVYTHLNAGTQKDQWTKGMYTNLSSADTEGQSAQPREERISIGQFGDTIDASILKELEEEDLRGGPDNEENSEQWGVEDEGEVSIEDIFNIDSTQIQTLRSDGSAVLGTILSSKPVACFQQWTADQIVIMDLRLCYRLQDLLV